jgi:hypothetical protein
MTTRARERELEDLYGLPLEQFTAARNELARRLEQLGDPRAAGVRKLTKPTLPVWAINQLARRDPLAIRRLLAAGDALRKAQERALRQGGAVSLGQAQADVRDAVRRLVGGARGVLADGGRPATDATLDRIAATLTAAAADDDVRPALKSGSLEAELQPSGFEALAGLELPPPAQPAGDRRRARQEQAQRGRELRNRVRELERVARTAEQEAERAEADARNKRHDADAARAAADEAAARLKA